MRDGATGGWRSASVRIRWYAAVSAAAAEAGLGSRSRRPAPPHPPTPRERDWIEALAPFFQNYDTVDQRTRTAQYEAAMARLHEQYPNDSEAAIFYALALLEAVDLTRSRPIQVS